MAMSMAAVAVKARRLIDDGPSAHTTAKLLKVEIDEKKEKKRQAAAAQASKDLNIFMGESGIQCG